MLALWVRTRFHIPCTMVIHVFPSDAGDQIDAQYAFQLVTSCLELPMELEVLYEN